MNYAAYNKKGFLAPNSIRSCASFHAKILPDLRAIFRLHDCNGGVRIWNNMNDPEEIQEMIEKLQIISTESLALANFITDNYLNKKPCSGSVS